MRSPPVVMALAISLIATPLQAKDRLDVVAFPFSPTSSAKSAASPSRTTLVGPNGDVHVNTPAPQDVKKIADARLVVIYGPGLEGWLTRLMQSSSAKAQVVVVSEGITPLRLGSQADPHTWQSVESGQSLREKYPGRAC